MKMLTLWVVLFVLACGSTGGPGWTPEQCAEDIARAESIAKDVTALADREGKIDEADVAMYAGLARLILSRGCAYIPQEWARESP